MTYNWVVSNQDLSMHCKCCGASYKPSSPVAIAIYVAMMDAFLKAHKDCKNND